MATNSNTQSLVNYVTRQTLMKHPSLKIMSGAGVLCL